MVLERLETIWVSTHLQCGKHRFTWDDLDGAIRGAWKAKIYVNTNETAESTKVTVKQQQLS